MNAKINILVLVKVLKASQYYGFFLFVGLSALKLRKFSQNEEIFGRPEASGENCEKAGFEHFQRKLSFFFVTI